jgi:predicted lipoprotein with Yx(FWY)xxD motif
MEMLTSIIGRTGMKRHIGVVRVVATGAALAALAACGASPSSAAGSSGSGGGGSGTMLMTANTSLGTVVTDAKGFTLYRFAPDTMTSSACTGACATLWPPEPGMAGPAAGTTLPGKLTTITRPDGSTQTVYDGHPAYTYTKDSAPGQTNGEGVLNQWHVIMAGAGAGAAPATTAPSTNQPGPAGY